MIKAELDALPGNVGLVVVKDESAPFAVRTRGTCFGFVAPAEPFKVELGCDPAIGGMGKVGLWKSGVFGPRKREPLGLHDDERRENTSVSSDAVNNRDEFVIAILWNGSPDV